MEVTNAMRLLNSKKIQYETHYYDDNLAIAGMDVAEILGEDPNQVFKTLVTVSKSNKNYVFVIPSTKELDLKKAAKVCGEKSIDMLKSKDLLPLTGYIHGGCSPVGMKKNFMTYIDLTSENFKTIMISGGKRGIQIELNPLDLKKLIKIEVKDLVTE